ncbi:complement C1q-like protein 4 [Gigantopelta aegis]|uniref:complement C1q-like protein 4 n=1 Tax=Gigantopelta aegis TaxID=1735272 RepID=UPI001B88AA96|nr:complement C1q-like protein 4 [Gigantopelta aegis]
MVCPASGEFATKQDLEVLKYRIQSLETSKHDLEIKVQSLEAQLKTKEDRTPLIAFRAGFAQDPVPVKFHNGQIIIFDKVYRNDGNSYNEHSGMFHAPVSGLYSFTVQIFPNASGIFFEMVKDGKLITVLLVKGGETGSAQTVMYLKSGQEVWVVDIFGTNDSIRGHELSMFSGFLIRASNNPHITNGGPSVVG